MSFLDLRTIVFMMIVTNCLCTILLVMLWRQNRFRLAGINLLATDFALQTTALFLIVLRGNISDWLSIVSANLMIVGGGILGYVGLQKFMGNAVSKIFNILLLVIFAVVHTYFTFINPDLAIRTLNLSTALFIVCFQCFWITAINNNKTKLSITKEVGIVFAAFCIIHIARIVDYIVSSNNGIDYFKSGLFETLVLIIYQILFFLLAYSLSLMVNKSLFMDLRFQEEKFFKAFHFSPYAIILSRQSDGRILEVNTGFQNITGYAGKEVVGKTSLEMNFWHHEEDRQTFIEELSKNTVLLEKEIKFRKKSGEMRIGLCWTTTIDINAEPCLLLSMTDSTNRKIIEEERERLISDLRKAVSEIKTLSGMLPICSSCKKIRDDSGYWKQVETYISEHSAAEFTHGICPDCLLKLYPDFVSKIDNGNVATSFGEGRS